MIEQIVGFRAERNLRAFPQLEALLQRQIELRKPGAAQDIAPGIAKLNQHVGVPILLPFGQTPLKGSPTRSGRSDVNKDCKPALSKPSTGVKGRLL